VRRNDKREPSTEGQVVVCSVRLADLGLTEGMVLIDPGRSANCGRVTYKRDPETGQRVVVGCLPGESVVSEEVFDRMCAFFAARRRGRPTRYLCAGLAICGSPGCGFPLSGRAQKSMKPYLDGSVRRHYWCVPSIGGCSKTSIEVFSAAFS